MQRENESEITSQEQVFKVELWYLISISSYLINENLFTCILYAKPIKLYTYSYYNFNKYDIQIAL